MTANSPETTEHSTSPPARSAHRKLEPEEVIAELATNLLIERASLRRQLLRVMWSSMLVYLVLALTAVARSAVNSLSGQGTIKIADLTLTIGAESGAVIVTALITGSIALNVILTGRDFQDAVQSNVPETLADVARFSRVANRGILMQSTMQGFACIAGLVGLAVVADAFRTRTLDLIGSGAVAFAAFGAATLYVHTGENERLARIAAILRILRKNRELGLLSLAYRYWSGQDLEVRTTRISITGAKKRKLRPYLAQLASIAAITGGPPILTGIALCWWNDLRFHHSITVFLVAGYVGIISTMLCGAITSALANFYARRWLDLVGSLLVCLVSALMVLLFLATSLTASAWQAKLWLVLMTTISPIISVCIFLVCVSRKTWAGRHVANIVSAKILRAYGSVQRDEPVFIDMNRRYFRRTQAWLQRRSGLSNEGTAGL